MGVKLIALDMDGTLVDASHTAVSPRNTAAVRAAAELGIHVVLASGRPLALMRETAAELGCIRYAISANGGAVWDLQEDKLLVDRAIPAPQSREILAILTDYPIAAEAYCGGKAYVDVRTWRFEGYQKQAADFLAYRAARNAVCEDLTAAVAGQAVEKFNVDGLSHSLRDAVLARLEPLRGNLAVNYIECYENLEISRADATKGGALAALCASLGITAGEVMAVGDSDNDADMLRWAFWSFAMAGGEPAALAAARRLTGSNAEDGVAMAIERYALGAG